MKSLLLVLSVTLVFAFTYKATTLSKQERKFATKFLKTSETSLADAVAGLSEKQLRFKPAADAWSIEDVVKHIAMSEETLWQMMDATVKQPANPEKRSNIKANDEQVIQMIENRSQKFKTSEALEPKNAQFLSMNDALDAFRKSRSRLITFVRSTDQDLRNHVATTPAGDFDSYQVALFIASHTNRHRQQIMEIKSHQNFPLN